MESSPVRPHGLPETVRYSRIPERQKAQWARTDIPWAVPLPRYSLSYFCSPCRIPENSNSHIIRFTPDYTIPNAKRPQWTQYPYTGTGNQSFFDLKIDVAVLQSFSHRKFPPADGNQDCLFLKIILKWKGDFWLELFLWKETYEIWKRRLSYYD